MPKITIHGFDSFLVGLKGGLEEFNEELSKGYQKVISETGTQIAKSASAILGKPSWQLSKAIAASKLKVYRSGKKHVVFRAVESKENLNPRPNTPAAYAFFQENGYVVKLNTMVRAKKSRIISVDNKGRRVAKNKAAYRKQFGKKFMKRAADAHFPELAEKIRQIHNETHIRFSGTKGAD